MDVIFSDNAIAVASKINASTERTYEGKLKAGRMVEDQLVGCSIFLGAVRGSRETADLLYLLADHFAGLPESANDTDPTVREWK